jgi:hypothetical protein
MKHDKAIVLRLTQEMFDQLKANRQMTGVTTSEFCRRAINLALYADIETANRTALWKSLPPEQRERPLDFSNAPEVVRPDETRLQ